VWSATPAGTVSTGLPAPLTSQDIGTVGVAGSATATAVGETTVVPVDERRFQRCVMQTPYFAQAVMRVMAERLRRNGGQPG
jgi:CRP-like cAMP-binding protein